MPINESDQALIAEFQKLVDAMRATDEARMTTMSTTLAELKALYEKIPEQIETKAVDLRAQVERLVKERTARGPGFGNVAGDVDVRSLGQRFAEHEIYKSAHAGNFAGRVKLSITLPGRFERKAITEAGSGYPIVPVRVGHVAMVQALPLAMRDLLNVVTISATNAIEYVKETWTYAADYQILEGDKKAEGSVAYTDATAMVRTIAWFVKVSRQMMSDVPYFASTIDDQLLYGVALKEDLEILMGTNAAGHLWGIYPQASAAAATAFTGTLYSADMVLSGIAQLAAAGFRPTAIVLNPTDWAAMQVSKTAQGVYILGGPPVSAATPTLWNLPVALTFNMPAGQYLVGAFAGNATLFDREQASVEISFENEDDFVRNMVTIRCEERIALAVYRPQAFIKGTLTPPTVP